MDRCRERDSYNHNISYYREKIYGIYRTCRSFDDKAITMRKLLYWCPMCCLPDEVEAKVLLSQLRVQLMRIYVYPAGLHGTDAVPRIEKTYTAEQSDRTFGLLFFRTHNEFYKISKYTEKLQKMLCSGVPVFRYIFCGIKILFSIYP